MKNIIIFLMVFVSFNFLAHAQTLGATCTVSGRTQISSNISEGLIQCRSGVWTYPFQSSN